jgi:hypothetical protein
LRKAKTTQTMKTPSIPRFPLLKAGAIATLCLLAFPGQLQAKGPRGGFHGFSQKKSKAHGSSDHDRQSYISHPRSSFILSFGNGYAGQGYYYGPPNSNYYYQRSDVRYFANRESAPREYYGSERYQGGSTDASVQRALAHRGYYRGSIDGQIGPQSRRAIASYQQDRGMRPTGYVTSQLLDSLGLR